MSKRSYLRDYLDANWQLIDHQKVLVNKNKLPEHIEKASERSFSTEFLSPLMMVVILT